MREADVAIRLRQPTQPDLIQRKLFSVRFHAYASPEYIKRFGTPRTLEDLDNHRVLLLGGTAVPNYLENRRWLIEVARNGKGPRTSDPHHQQRSRRPARVPARHRRRAAAGLSGRGERRAGAAVRRIRHDLARRLFRLSGRTQVGRARAGVSRLSGRQGAALAFLTRPRGFAAPASVSIAAFRMAGMRPFVLSQEIASAILRLTGGTGCPSSQIATVKPAAVPLWKVIVGPAPTN